MELAERGKTKEARAALTRLLNEHPEDPNVCYGIGTLHAISGELKESIKWFDQAIAAAPDFVEAYHNKATAYQKLLDVANAIRAYRKVLELAAPGSMSATQAKSFLDDMASFIQQNDGVDLECYLDSQSEFDLAFKLMERRDWAGALAGFRASAAKIDRNSPVHGNMGLCLAHLGHKALALAEFDRALELDPGYSPAATNRLVAEQMEEGAPLKSVRTEIVEFARESILGASKAQE